MMHRCIKLTDHGVLAPSRLPRPGHSVRFRFGFSTAWMFLHFGTAGGLYSMEWEWREGVDTGQRKRIECRGLGSLLRTFKTRSAS
jgi:hypothetical protein